MIRLGKATSTRRAITSWMVSSGIIRTPSPHRNLYHLMHLPVNPLASPSESQVREFRGQAPKTPARTRSISGRMSW